MDIMECDLLLYFLDHKMHFFLGSTVKISLVYSSTEVCQCDLQNS